MDKAKGGMFEGGRWAWVWWRALQDENRDKYTSETIKIMKKIYEV